ncbi:MAG TPA: hypothetical protein VKA46_28195 [Gemmataceae bacterium]|nr:hypothetical protein [Gemmataceae bacterium]
MARTDGRHSSHIQEKRPPSGGNSASPPPASAGEERQAAQEGRDAGWRWAATLWAIVFLFLTALLLFDLLAGLIHR